MFKKQLSVSKFIALVLRHKPEVIGLKLSEEGWADVDELIDKLNARGNGVDRPFIDNLVAEDDKKRYAFSPDGKRIRAVQGHSLKVDLGLKNSRPPDVLYHGTSVLNFEKIEKQGILKMERQHVQLSTNVKTALEVGRRHGQPIVLEVYAGEMEKVGKTFSQAENGVWLTETVPVGYFARVRT